MRKRCLILPPFQTRPILDDLDGWRIRTTHLYRYLAQAIGYVYVEVRCQPETSSHYAMECVYIHQMSLKPEYQAQGYGKKLMEAVKDLAREKGIFTIALDVWTFNTQAKAFYQKQGFVNYNERMWLKLTDR
jgi:GNAT superfamily N-acetyltransferase